MNLFKYLCIIILHSSRDNLSVSSKQNTTEKLGIAFFFNAFELTYVTKSIMIIFNDHLISQPHSILAIQEWWLERKEIGKSMKSVRILLKTI